MLFFQGLEATLNDPKKRYPDKVNALLSAWEHVTAFIATSAHEASETLIDWVHRCVYHSDLDLFWHSLSHHNVSVSCLICCRIVGERLCAAAYVFPLQFQNIQAFKCFL